MKIIILILVVCLAAKQLKFIQVISRHGVREPLYPNNYDYSNTSNLNTGALTIQGKSMHYLLGKHVYDKYWQLLFNNTQYQHSYDQSIIYAKSTNTDRTIESLQSQIHGLLQDLHRPKQVKATQFYLPPIASSKFGKLSGEQAKAISSLFTFPIHVQEGAEGHAVAGQQYQGDYLTKLFQNLCPNQKRWKEQNYKSALGLRIQNNSKIKSVVTQLKQVYNTSQITIKNAYKYIDNYICLKATSKKYLPIFQDPSIKSTIDFLYILPLYLANLYTDIQRRTFSTTPIHKTIDNIKNAVKGIGPKIVLWAVHDTTLATLFAALNLTNIQCIFSQYLSGKNEDNCYSKYPVFGSSLIIQVWEQNGQDLIKILINGEPYSIPICKYSLECPIKEFQAWFLNFKVSNPNQQCGLFHQQCRQNYYLQFAFFIIGFIVALIILKVNRPQSSRIKDGFVEINSQ